MNTRCIAEKIPGGRGDGLDHLGGEGGRSVVVEVDTHGERFMLTFPLSSGTKRTRQAFYRVLYLLRLESEAQQAYTLTPPRKQDRRRFTCGNGMNQVRPASGQPAAPPAPPAPATAGAPAPRAEASQNRERDNV